MNSDDMDIKVYKMPQTCQGLLRIIELRNVDIKQVIHGTERLWPRQMRSATSTFRMGLEAGSCEMAHNAMKYMHPNIFGIVHIIAPQTWQAKIGAPKRPKDLPADKAYSQHKKNLWKFAQELYPGVKILKDTCDSVLIAHYLKQEHQLGNL